MINERKIKRKAARQCYKGLKNDPKYKGTKHLRYRAKLMGTCAVDRCPHGEEHADFLINKLEKEKKKGNFLTGVVCKTLNPEELSTHHRRVKSSRAAGEADPSISEVNFSS